MKTKLTPELQEKICDLISKGNYIERACAAVGITSDCYRKWCQKAREDGGDSIYVSFLSAVKKAEADCQVRLLSKIEEVGAKSWQAYATIMERRFASEWSQSSRGSVAVDVTHNIVSISEIARTYDSPELPEVEGEFKEIEEGEG